LIYEKDEEEEGIFSILHQPINKTDQINHKLKTFQRAKTYNEQKFEEEDQELEEMKEAEGHLHSDLVRERERLRKKRVDLDFQAE